MCRRLCSAYKSADIFTLTATFVLRNIFFSGLSWKHSFTSVIINCFLLPHLVLSDRIVEHFSPKLLPFILSQKGASLQRSLPQYKMNNSCFVGARYCAGLLFTLFCGLCNEFLPFSTSSSRECANTVFDVVVFELSD